MPIYSKNRSGMLKESVGSYGMNDAGRIIYESFVNDHTIFEAIIKHDMNEIQGLREGTILEADVEKDNKKSIEELKRNIFALVGRAKEKILGMLRDLKNKIINFLMNDGKEFVNEYTKFRSEHQDSNSEIEIETYDFKNNYNSIFNDFADNLSKFPYIANENDLEKYIDDKGNFNKDEFLTELVKSINVPSECKTMDDIEEYYKTSGIAKFKIKVFSDEEKSLLDFIGNSKGLSNQISSSEKVVMTKVDNVFKSLKDNKEIYEKYSAAINQYFSFVYYYITKCTSIYINKTLKSVGDCRKALGALMAKVKADENGATKTQAESAILTSLVEAAIELDDAFDGEPADDTTECDNLEDLEKCDF